jgi:hypothetical protein
LFLTFLGLVARPNIDEECFTFSEHFPQSYQTGTANHGSEDDIGTPCPSSTLKEKKPFLPAPSSSNGIGTLSLSQAIGISLTLDENGLESQEKEAEFQLEPEILHKEFVIENSYQPTCKYFYIFREQQAVPHNPRQLLANFLGISQLNY